MIFTNFVENKETMVLKFEWDKGNHRHFYIDNLEREITIEEAESIFYDENMKVFDGSSANENRYICIGKSIKNRIIAVVFTERQGLIRPITGFSVKRGKYLKLYEDHE